MLGDRSIVGVVVAAAWDDVGVFLFLLLLLLCVLQSSRSDCLIRLLIGVVLWMDNESDDSGEAVAVASDIIIGLTRKLRTSFVRNKRSFLLPWLSNNKKLDTFKKGGSVDLNMGQVMADRIKKSRN